MELKSVSTQKSPSINYLIPTQKEIITRSEDAIRIVPLLMRAMRIRYNTLLSVPLYVYEGNKQIENYEFEESYPLKKLIQYVEMYLLCSGNAYIRKYYNSYNYFRDIEVLNSFTMKKDVVGNTVNYYQLINTTRIPSVGYFNIEKDLHIITEPNPLSNYEGLSPLEIAFKHLQLSSAVARMLTQLFAGDGVPVTLIISEGVMSDEQSEKVENWFRRKFRSFQNSINRVLGITGNIKIEKITSTLKDYDIPEVDDYVMKAISDSFDIPMSILRSDSGANRAISDNDRRSFIVSTIQPRCEFIQAEINQLLKPFNQKIEFVVQEMPEMQEDETARSSSLLQLVNAGVPLEIALDILGYYIPEEKKKLLQESALPLQKKTMWNELDKWERKCLNMLKTQGNIANDFKSYILPTEMINSIKTKLEVMQSQDEVKELFKHYKESLNAIS